MILKIKAIVGFVLIVIAISFASCGIYSLSGANVEGKTINVHYLENVAGNVAPRLSSVLTDKLRTKILNQTTLSNIGNGNADYELNGQITNYSIGVAAVSTADISTKNRLSITVEIKFDNNINNKNSWVQSFTKFADYPSTQNLQSVESKLIEEISEELADQIFAKAFVNW